MDIKEEKICRLCFNHAETIEVIDEVAMEMLDVLLLKMDLDVSENPIMCQNCSKTVKRSYNFKSICKETEKCFVKNEAKVESTDEWEEVTGVDESSSKCRFCMSPQTVNDVVPMDVLIKNPKFGEIWPIIMPTMDLQICKNSLLCIHCHDNLVSYFNFVQNCWDTEEKINTYCQRKGTNSEGKVNLNHVQRFIIEDIPEHSNKTAIKQEPCDDLLNHEETEAWRSSWRWRKETSQIEMYKCAACPFETKYKGNLKNHMLVHKDASEIEMYKCALCPYETKYNGTLKTHMLVHKDTSEVEMHKCALCPFETKYKQHLKSHMIVHKDTSEVEMHKCPVCVYETKHKGSLRSHMFVHKDPSEMYKCTLCVFKTTRKGSLKSHMLTHIRRLDAKPDTRKVRSKLEIREQREKLIFRNSLLFTKNKE